MKSEPYQCRLYSSQADTIEFRLAAVSAVVGDPYIIMSCKDNNIRCSIMNLRNIHREDIPNLSKLSDDVLFQLSCVWDKPIDFFLLHAIHVYGKEQIESYVHGESLKWETTFEY